jgi:hypothetical protein
VVRLGRGVRLRDVDPTGRLGLVSRLAGRMRLFDLRRLRWVKGPALPRFGLGGAATTPRLTASGRLLVPAFTTSSGIDGTFAFRGVDRTSLVSATTDTMHLRRPAHSIAVSAVGDRYSYACSDETVELVTFGAPPRSTALVGLATDADHYRVCSLDPLPGKVVQATCTDGERDLVAAGTWELITLHRIEDGSPVSVARIESKGDVRWLGLGGPWLLGLTSGADGQRLRGWRLDDITHVPGPMAFEHEVRGAVTAASIARDGTHAAIAITRARATGVIARQEHVVQLITMRSGAVETFTEHTDEIGLVRFVGEDNLLITADDDNRVVLRPRLPGGYAKALLAIPVRSAAISIDEALRELRRDPRHLQVRD